MSKGAGKTTGRLMTLLCALLYGTTGILWIGNGLRRGSVYYVLLGLLWLSGAVIWILRYRKERKESKKEK